MADMTRAGLRELRQQARDLVRQAEAGETIVVTVSGREVAQLGPVRQRRWRRAADVSDVFTGPARGLGRRPRPAGQHRSGSVRIMRSVLDTSVLLGPGPGDLQGELAISAASLAELHYGVLVARTDRMRAERLRRLASVERTFDALPVDDTVAREYGRLAASVAASGGRPRARVMDLLIAATAAAYDARLVTRDTDLARLGDLVEVVTLP